MRSGYGRGYYGNGQLAPSAPQQRTGWGTILVVVGVGAAAAWFLWPRGSSPGPELPGGGGGGKDPDPPMPALPSPPPGAVQPVASSPSASAGPSLASTAMGAFAKQVEDDARARGFVSASDYEDSVVETAKQLKATGAQVTLAPHLQHLAPRLGT